MANGFYHQPSLASGLCWWSWCNTRGFKWKGVMFGGQFPTNPPPWCNSWFIYCMRTFIHLTCAPVPSNVQGFQTFIKPNSWTGWANCTKWRMILEYPNEMKLKWGTIIEREEMHRKDKISAQFCKSIFLLMNRISAHFLGHLLLG